ncbi:Phosphatidylinositol 3-kinase VPS34 [Mycena indigotica]|uniref:Phosphatidylinositol 3-kinase VPS34 n=1 Tax=Mycena indigotica TaxID=2126181 RepID=A0A8H6WFR1_9AGAR|nr:Phosphatidylinositol 3-kinase VPS34 [Mycena indigotica]KAF7316022.1 Phosphatidylinositol 3-kinase VPS34 [Mycena indigotica]
MDKDDFTLIRTQLPVTFRISQLEGIRQPHIYRAALSIFHPFRPIYVTYQLIADNKLLTIPFHTSFKAFKNSYTWNAFGNAAFTLDASEVKQAVEELLPQWTETDTDDALELLGPSTVDSRVRAFAVWQLSRADDEVCHHVLYRQTTADQPRTGDAFISTDQRSLRSKTTSAISYEDSGLTDFLISRGVANPVLGNRLYWYLMVEVALEDRVMGEKYGRVVFRFMGKILESEGGSDRRELMRRQRLMVDSLAKRAKELRMSKDPRPKKIDKLLAIITDTRNNLASMPPLPLCSRDNRNMFPLLLYFQYSAGSTYPVLLKDGDDMRQDQLVIQLFTLIDGPMRKEKLDLKLTPYDVLATGPLQGMVRFVPGKTIAAIVSEHGNLLDYLRAHNPDTDSVGTSGVNPTVIDTFVWSCAGYCVVTYLLGVSDRHLDNLFVSPDGDFFYVDFDYILGRDPKPFPLPVKVCKEMGGAQWPHYQRFKSFCFMAFTMLVKRADLILNLVTLMVDANIPDIKHRDRHGQIHGKAAAKKKVLVDSNDAEGSGDPFDGPVAGPILQVEPYRPYSCATLSSREITYVPGFSKLVNKIIVNADNYEISSPPVDALKVEIETEAANA